MSLDFYLIIDEDDVYQDNVTHNLNVMADRAGPLYRAMWRPEELGITKAKDLIPHLVLGCQLLVADPLHFQQFNPENGWGDYDGLLKAAVGYLLACQRYPDADIRVSR